MGAAMGALAEMNCILVGLTRGTDFIGESKLAFNKFFPILQAALQDGGECFITINNPKELI